MEPSELCSVQPEQLYTGALPTTHPQLVGVPQQDARSTLPEVTPGDITVT